jgi:peptidoglycan/LPS O-acetylase OafA/YrhL
MHRDTTGLLGWPRLLAWGLPAALTVAASLSITAPTNGFLRLLVLIGDASYALYLTHPFVMIGYGLMLRTKAVSQASQIMIVPVIVLLTIIVGVAAHLAIETPLLRLIRRWTRRERLVAEAAAHP